MQKPHLKMMVGSILQDFDENDIGKITATFDEAEIYPIRLVSHLNLSINFRRF